MFEVFEEDFVMIIVEGWLGKIKGFGEVLV